MFLTYKKPLTLDVQYTFILLFVFVFGFSSQLQAQSDINAKQSIMVLGDSLSASYGIKRNQGWVALLEARLQSDQQYSSQYFTIINASISGETSGGALQRLPALLQQHEPDVVIIELGGNDGLRGHPIKTLRNNLAQLASLCQQSGSLVLLAGMKIPPNYGPRYTQQFYDSYSLIAKKFQLVLVPFLLDDIAINSELMQRDGIHPTAQAQPLILQNVMPYLQPLLIAQD